MTSTKLPEEVPAGLDDASGGAHPLRNAPPRAATPAPVMMQETLFGAEQKPKQEPARGRERPTTQPVTNRMSLDDVIGVLHEENRALEEALAVSRRRLAGMRDVAHALAGRLDLDALLRSIISKVTELCDCDRATLFVVDETRQEIWSRVIDGVDEIRLPLGRGIAGFVATSGLGLNITDVYDDPRFDRSVDLTTGYRTKSMLAFPILSPAGRVTGVVEALNKRLGPFSVEDERLLEAVSSQISVALKNALLFEELKDKAASLEAARGELNARIAELDVLVDLERAFAAADTTEQFSETVLVRARQLLSADGALLALLDAQGRIQLRCTTGTGERRAAAAVELDAGLIADGLKGGAPVRVADASAQPRALPRVLEELGLAPGPLLAVPFSSLGRPLGALVAVRNAGRTAFDDDDQRILMLLASRVAHGLAFAQRRERTKNEEHLERLGTMLAGIVHDLKTPMTVISGYVQLMALEEDPAERERNAETVLKNCDQMTSMIKELLQFTRGETEILIRKVYMQSFFQEVEDIVHRLVEGKDIVVSTAIGYRGAVRMDDLKLKRAVLNLAKNAVEAMGGSGALTFTVEQAGDMVEIAVKDTGPGLPKEIEGRLFEQFATHGKKEGTGLGLALTRKIIADHQGEIRVESRSGEGCTFRLRLPL